MKLDPSTAWGSDGVPESQGQDKGQWTQFWGDRTPDGELKYIDNLYFRPWVVKYVPRFGKSVEAGCGMGAYVSYLRHLGIDIEGIEFSSAIAEKVNAYGAAKGMDLPIRTGDVTKMSYENNSLAGYLSFGVVEHFEEGPERALDEAFRVLRPGGIAIVTTPAPGYSRRIQAWRETVECLRHLLKYARWRDFHKMWQSLRAVSHVAPNLCKNRTATYINKTHLLDLGQFWQYEYKPGRLRKNLVDAGFSVIWSGSTDLKFNEFNLGRWRIDEEDDLKRLRLLDRLEASLLVNLGGAFAVTVSVKVAGRMHCFLCGEPRVTRKSVGVPICSQCTSSPVAHHYFQTRRPHLADRWLYNPSVASSAERECVECSTRYREDPIFGDSGFLDPVCGSCIRDPRVNIHLSNERLKLVWRPRA